MINVTDAKTAFELATNINKGNFNEEYDEIFNQIKKAVNEGSFQIYINSISPECMRKFRELGFTVETQEGRYNESEIIISWANPK